LKNNRENEKKKERSRKEATQKGDKRWTGVAFYRSLGDNNPEDGRNGKHVKQKKMLESEAGREGWGDHIKESTTYSD